MATLAFVAVLYDIPVKVFALTVTVCLKCGENKNKGVMDSATGYGFSFTVMSGNSLSISRLLIRRLTCSDVLECNRQTLLCVHMYICFMFEVVACF